MKIHQLSKSHFSKWWEMRKMSQKQRCSKSLTNTITSILNLGDRKVDLGQKWTKMEEVVMNQYRERGNFGRKNGEQWGWGDHSSQEKVMKSRWDLHLQPGNPRKVQYEGLTHYLGRETRCKTQQQSVGQPHVLVNSHKSNPLCALSPPSKSNGQCLHERETFLPTKHMERNTWISE